jgi:16S rRNA (guanine527-N7)-methyltransferase
VTQNSNLTLKECLEQRISIIKGLGFSELAVQGLEIFLDRLWQANEELNLISRKMTPTELIDNHVIDCLLPLKFFPDQAKEVADFGSGGGLPAIIYALQFPHVQFHLFEKSPKKQAFLKSCSLFTSNLIIHSEIPTLLPKVDLVTARGFKPIDVILEMSRNYAATSGHYFLLKGRAEKIESELQLARKKFPKLICHIDQLQSPVLAVDRHLVRIEFGP